MTPSIQGHRARILAAAALLGALAAQAAPVKLGADGTTDTYTLIESKNFGLETPDCKHPVKHVRQVYDGELKKYVFAFDIHRDLDDDRCINEDRQRMEIKDSPDGSPTTQHQRGDTAYYRWKFKLPAGFKPSPSFTHIHQVKAEGGDDDSPILTLTPRAGSPDQLQVIYTAGSGGSGSGVVAQVDLAPFVGTWVEGYVRMLSDDAGSIQVSLRRISDGKTLLSWKSGTLDTWRSGASYNREKWGIYRSLDNVSYLRDETLLFADFCVSETAKAECPSAIGKK